MGSFPRMRTVQQCVTYLKENDPDCCIGEWYIRKMIKEEKIPVKHSGKRILVNLDKLLAYLSDDETDLEVMEKEDT